MLCCATILRSNSAIHLIYYVQYVQYIHASPIWTFGYSLIVKIQANLSHFPLNVKYIRKFSSFWNNFSTFCQIISYFLRTRNSHPPPFTAKSRKFLSPNFRLLGKLYCFCNSAQYMYISPLIAKYLHAAKLKSVLQVKLSQKKG